MEFDMVRPVVSGLIGSLLATWLMASWARFVPRGHGRKSDDALVAEYRWLIRASNTIFITCVLGALAAYMFSFAAHNDFSTLLIAFGAGTVFPLLLLGFIGIRHGRLRAAEAFTAICIASKTPVVVAIVLIAFGAACFVGGLALLE